MGIRRLFRVLIKMAPVYDPKLVREFEIAREKVWRDANSASRIEGENLEATAAIFLFTDFSAQSPESFHLHGDPEDAPLTAVLVFPESQRSHDQLIGDFALEETLQAVRPTIIMRTVLGIVLRVREGLSIYFATVAVSTIAFFGLVLTLSLRLRRAEMRLMRRIGCSRSAIALIVGTEVVLVVVAAIGLTALASAMALTLLRSQLGL